MIGREREMTEKGIHTFAVLAYGNSPYIEECIQSLKNQTFMSTIVLATSTPSPFLYDFSERYDIPLMVNSDGKGIASDWTFAYNSSKTRYVTLAHQDDIYLPEYTEHCLSVAERNPDCLIAFTDYFALISGERKRFTLNQMVKKLILLFLNLHTGSISGRSQKKMLLSFGNPICCPSVMFNKEKIGHFEFSGKFSYNLDWDAWHRLSLRNGGFVYLKRRLMLHRIHKESELIKGTVDETRNKEDYLLFQKFWPEPFAQMIAKMYIFFSYKFHL